MIKKSFNNPIQKLAVQSINFYQKAISPGLGKNCRFYPSCSHYAALAIEKDGFLKGSFKSIIRILKCGPWHQGGVDLP